MNRKIISMLIVGIFLIIILQPLSAIRTNSLNKNSCEDQIYDKLESLEDGWLDVDIYYISINEEKNEIRGASVKAENIDTGIMYTDFVFNENSWTYYMLVPPGNYRINKVSRAGFYDESDMRPQYIDPDSAGDFDVEMFKVSTVFKPILDGPRMGEPGIEYEYAILGIDSNQYDLYHYVDWGDGTNSSWVGPANTGGYYYISHT